MASRSGKCILVGPFHMRPDEEADCCVACHLSWEEQHALPYLPPHHRAWIRQEHAFMRDRKKKTGLWPTEMLIEHAEVEDELFGLYMPEAVFARMHKEHQVLDYKIRNGLPLDD